MPEPPAAAIPAAELEDRIATLETMLADREAALAALGETLAEREAALAGSARPWPSATRASPR